MSKSRRTIAGAALPLLGALFLSAGSASGLSAQQPPYKRDLPARLVKQAAVPETTAAKTALGRVPNGHILAVELENEAGKLMYSYEIKVSGKSGVEEVNVDATSGTVIAVEHETPATERKEAAAEKRTKKPEGFPEGT